jgi:hypothetical protein
MDFDKLTASTTLLQERYPGSSMAAIFHHALEVGMYLYSGSDENKATAWPFLDIMCQAFAGQSATVLALQNKITTLENTADIAKAAEATKAAKLKVAESATKIAHKKIQELDIKSPRLKQPRRPLWRLRASTLSDSSSPRVYSNTSSNER